MTSSLSSYRTPSGLGSRRGSATGTMILQCPACQTKFALDCDSVSEIEDPRFHCSRCDHVFGIDECRKPLVSVPQKDPAPLQTQGTAARSEQSLLSDQRAPASRSLTVPDSIKATFPLSPPHETVEPPIGEPQIGRPRMRPRDLGEASSGAQMELPLPELSPYAPEIDDEEEWLDNKNSLLGSLFAKSSASGLRRPAAASPQEHALAAGIGGSPQSPAPDSSYFAGPDSLEAEPTAGKPFAGSWSGLMLVFAPCLIFLTLLAAGSYFLVSADKNSFGAALTGIVSAISPDAPRMPPSGLYIKNSRLREVTLDSGETVLVVSGKITNDSGSEFRDITIEAIGFDAQNKPIVRTRTSAFSPLAKSKIKSLTPDLLYKAQKSEASNGKLFKAGAEEPFAIVLGDGANNQFMASPQSQGAQDDLNDGKANPIRFLATRILSVK